MFPFPLFDLYSQLNSFQFFQKYLKTYFLIKLSDFKEEINPNFILIILFLILFFFSLQLKNFENIFRNKPNNQNTGMILEKLRNEQKKLVVKIPNEYLKGENFIISKNLNWKNYFKFKFLQNFPNFLLIFIFIHGIILQNFMGLFLVTLSLYYVNVYTHFIWKVLFF
jgi:hypothetical protein